MLARGIRNNNPGNIRRTSELWLGLSEGQTDDTFCQFKTMAYGCRALLRTLRTYHKRYGLNTVAGIIKRWAPSNENNTKAYIASVEELTGFPAHIRLDFELNPAYYIVIAKAITRVECGKDDDRITEDDWRKAADMADISYDA